MAGVGEGSCDPRGESNITTLASGQKQVYTRAYRAQALLTGGMTRVLEHLVQGNYDPAIYNSPMDGFLPLEKADANELLEAQINTTDWLTELGAKPDDDVVADAQDTQARNAFHALTADPETAKQALTQITLPPAIQRLVSMLTVYDWSFVEHAKQLRGMAVAKILEETDHPDARIRLKALEMLGKVTEVGLFTDRIEIKKTELSDHELDEKIKQKLAAIQNTVEVDATEVETIDDEQD